MSKSIFSLAINPFALGAVFLHEITPCIYSDSSDSSETEMLHGSREVPIIIPKYHVVFQFIQRDNSLDDSYARRWGYVAKGGGGRRGNLGLRS